MKMEDPWADRLSEAIDGELDEHEQRALDAHLDGCARCRALLADLRALVTAARALPARAPERDLWPAVEVRLAAPGRASPRRPLAFAFAAGVLLALGAAFLLTRPAPEERAAPDQRVARSGMDGAESYLLLLHEPPDLGAGMGAAEHAEIVARYARWAEDLGARCAGGEELEASGLELRAGETETLVAALPERERVGGYFLLEVRDRDEALALARTCPHLDQGGWIELRRIRTQ